MSNGNWQNQYGWMKWANFCANKQVRVASLCELTIVAQGATNRFLAELEEFREKLLPTDTLCHFDADQSRWDQGFGSEGFAIVRDGELVATLVVKMN